MITMFAYAAHVIAIVCAIERLLHRKNVGRGARWFSLVFSVAGVSSLLGLMTGTAAESTLMRALLAGSCLVCAFTAGVYFDLREAQSRASSGEEQCPSCTGAR